MQQRPEDPVAPLPLTGAEVRIRQTRSYLRIVEPLLETELKDQDQRFADLLSEVMRSGGEHPQFGNLAFEAANVAHDRLEEAREQLPTILRDSLLIYAGSMVDAMLVDCIETMESWKHCAAPDVREKSPYRRRMIQLQGLGLKVKLPTDLEMQITNARQRRNAVVHERSGATTVDVRLALNAAEGLLSYLRAALVAFEEAPDHITSRFERRALPDEAL